MLPGEIRIASSSSAASYLTLRCVRRAATKLAINKKGTWRFRERADPPGTLMRVHVVFVFTSFCSKTQADVRPSGPHGQLVIGVVTPPYRMQKGVRCCADSARNARRLLQIEFRLFSQARSS